MEDKEITIENNDYIKLSRSIASAFLDNLLLFDEMIILIWLWIQANPRNGRAMASYEGLRKNFKCRYSKNQINKIMLALKQKRLIWFPRQQGRRGSFYVDIQNYPLPDKSFRNISRLFGDDIGRSSEANISSNQAELATEVKPDWQKLNEAKMSLAEGFSMNPRDNFGRSSNNDNEKENYKNRSQISKSFKRIGFDDFDPQSYEEGRCKEIARYLGEKDMTFILSVLRRYGFRVIEKAYIEIREREGSIQNRGAYFNARVEQLTKEKYT